MKSFNLFLGEKKNVDSRPFQIGKEAVINLIGVILFYVVFFVAFSVFSG